MVRTFPKGTPNPFLARQSLENDPFPYVEIAPFMHLYHAPFDGQKLIEATEIDGEATGWDQSKTGSRTDGLRATNIRTSRAKELTTMLEGHDPLANTYTEMQKVAYPVLYEAERAVWDYRLVYDLRLNDSQGWSINKYGHGGEYKIHTDHGTHDPRIISCLIYLNTVKDGGATTFPFQNVSVPCVEGNILVFPSSYAYAHASAPVGVNSDEIKYSIAGFFV